MYLIYGLVCLYFGGVAAGEASGGCLTVTIFRNCAERSNEEELPLKSIVKVSSSLENTIVEYGINSGETARSYDFCPPGADTYIVSGGGPNKQLFWSISLPPRSLLGSHSTAFYLDYSERSEWRLLSSENAITAQPLCQHIAPHPHRIPDTTERALLAIQNNSCLDILFYPGCDAYDTRCMYPLAVTRPGGLPQQYINPKRLPSISRLCPDGEGEYRLGMGGTEGSSESGCSADDRRRTQFWSVTVQSKEVLCFANTTVQLSFHSTILWTLVGAQRAMHSQPICSSSGIVVSTADPITAPVTDEPLTEVTVMPVRTAIPILEPPPVNPAVKGPEDTTQPLELAERPARSLLSVDIPPLTFELGVIDTRYLYKYTVVLVAVALLIGVAVVVYVNTQRRKKEIAKFAQLVPCPLPRRPGGFLLDIKEAQDILRSVSSDRLLGIGRVSRSTSVELVGNNMVKADMMREVTIESWGGKKTKFLEDGSLIFRSSSSEIDSRIPRGPSTDYDFGVSFRSDLAEYTRQWVEAPRSPPATARTGGLSAANAQFENCDANEEKDDDGMTDNEAQTHWVGITPANII